MIISKAFTICDQTKTKKRHFYIMKKIQGFVDNNKDYEAIIESF